MECACRQCIPYGCVVRDGLAPPETAGGAGLAISSSRIRPLPAPPAGRGTFICVIYRSVSLRPAPSARNIDAGSDLMSEHLINSFVVEGLRDSSLSKPSTPIPQHTQLQLTSWDSSVCLDFILAAPHNPPWWGLCHPALPMRMVELRAGNGILARGLSQQAAGIRICKPVKNYRSRGPFLSKLHRELNSL